MINALFFLLFLNRHYFFLGADLCFIMLRFILFLLCRLHEIENAKLMRRAINLNQIILHLLWENREGTICIAVKFRQSPKFSVIIFRFQRKLRQYRIHLYQKFCGLIRIFQNRSQFFPCCLIEKILGKRSFNFLGKPAVKTNHTVCHLLPLICRHPCKIPGSQEPVILNQIIHPLCDLRPSEQDTCIRLSVITTFQFQPLCVIFSMRSIRAA